MARLLRQHDAGVHKQEKNYHCTLCEEKFSTNRSLQDHMKTVHYPDIKDVKCEQCDFATQTRSRLWTHKLTYHTVKTKEIKYECEPCDKSYTTKEGYQAHLSTAHSDVRHKCDICGSDFAQKTSLTFHKRMYHSRQMTE